MSLPPAHSEAWRCWNMVPPLVERCRRFSRAGGRAQSSCTDRGDHRSLRTRDRERVPRARIVVGRARWPSPRGDSGRSQDHISSHINEITGVVKNLHEDAGFHRSGSVESLLRRGLSGGAAQFPSRKVGSVGGNIVRAAMERGRNKEAWRSGLEPPGRGRFIFRSCAVADHPRGAMCARARGRTSDRLPAPSHDGRNPPLPQGSGGRHNSRNPCRKCLLALGQWTGSKKGVPGSPT